MTRWLLITVVIFLASTLQSMTGFGFAVLAVPFLVPLMPPRHAVALIAVLSTATTVLAWWRIRADTAPGWTWRLFMPGLLGVPLGIMALLSLQADWLRVLVGGGSLVIAGVLLWSHLTANLPVRTQESAGARRLQRSRPWAIWVAGLVSGVLSGSLGMPGPPIMVLLHYEDMPKHTYRATSLAYFTLIYPVTLLVMLAQGILTGQTFAESATHLPAVLGGILAGNAAHVRVPQQAFTLIVLALLGMGGLLAGWTGWQGLRQ
jgi:uncharacterized protein